MSTRRQVTLNEVEVEIAEFEARYGVSSADRRTIVPDGTDPCDHEDFVRWSRLIAIRDRVPARTAGG